MVPTVPQPCEAKERGSGGHAGQTLFSRKRKWFAHCVLATTLHTQAQPLNVSFMLPFKTHYAQKMESWLRMNATGVVTQYQIASLLGKAYLNAATVGVVVNVFRRTGLFPYNRHIFHESEFVQEIQNLSGCEETEHVLPGPAACFKCHKSKHRRDFIQACDAF
jgi:hypothetical protein